MRQRRSICQIANSHREAVEEDQQPAVTRHGDLGSRFLGLRPPRLQKQHWATLKKGAARENGYSAKPMRPAKVAVSYPTISRKCREIFVL